MPRARKPSPKKAAPASGPASPERAPTPASAPFRPARSDSMPRYAGVPTFLRLPLVDDSAAVDVLLLGVPFDGGATFRAGARLGPRAVRDASSLARSFSAALGIDIFSELAVADGGDVVVAPHDVDEAVAAVASRAERLGRSGVIPGFIGGDQTVTLGALRGLHKAKLRPLGLLHIDCHSNTHGPAWGHAVHHGSVMRLAVEEGLVRKDSVLQLGLRGPYSSAEELNFALSAGFEIVDVDEVKWDLHAAIRAVRKVAQTGPLYVSVDIAALDPAYAPGTGIPLPGGLNTWELQQVLRALVGAEVVGFDLVEIAPAYDHSGITALAGVSILQEILSAVADTRRSARPAPSSRDSRRGRRLSP